MHKGIEKFILLVVLGRAYFIFTQARKTGEVCREEPRSALGNVGRPALKRLGETERGQERGARKQFRQTALKA